MLPRSNHYRLALEMSLSENERPPFRTCASRPAGAKDGRIAQVIGFLDKASQQAP